MKNKVCKKRLVLLLMLSLSVNSKVQVLAEEKESMVQESIAQAETEEETENTEAMSGKKESDLQEGQRKATIMVVSITGNELTYYEIENNTEPESEAETDRTDESGTNQAEIGQKADEAEKNQPGGNMQPSEDAGGSKEGDMQIPESFGGSQGRNRQLSADSGDFQSSEKGMTKSRQGGSDSRSGFSGMPGMETKTIYIPVAAVVHTDTGEKRTFTILEAGDELEVMFEEADGEEIITEIWMEGSQEVSL